MTWLFLEHPRISETLCGAMGMGVCSLIKPEQSLYFMITDNLHA